MSKFKPFYENFSLFVFISFMMRMIIFGTILGFISDSLKRAFIVSSAVIMSSLDPYLLWNFVFYIFVCTIYFSLMGLVFYLILYDVANHQFCLNYWAIFWIKIQSFLIYVHDILNKRFIILLSILCCIGSCLIYYEGVDIFHLWYYILSCALSALLLRMYTIFGARSFNLMDYSELKIKGFLDLFLSILKIFVWSIIVLFLYLILLVPQFFIFYLFQASISFSIYYPMTHFYYQHNILCCLYSLYLFWILWVYQSANSLEVYVRTYALLSQCTHFLYKKLVRSIYSKIIAILLILVYAYFLVYQYFLLDLNYKFETAANLGICVSSIIYLIFNKKTKLDERMIFDEHAEEENPK